MPIGPGVRPSRLDDLDALEALENRCFTADRMSRRSFRAALRSPRAAVLVVPGASPVQLSGAAVLFFRANSETARLYSIAVAPEARGQGVGKRLLSAVERAARIRGARAIRLEVSVSNKSALALYRKSGYGMKERIAHYYEDGSDAWRLEKPVHRGKARGP
jgi:Acetyltransferases